MRCGFGQLSPKQLSHTSACDAQSSCTRIRLFSRQRAGDGNDRHAYFGASQSASLVHATSGICSGELLQISWPLTGSTTLSLSPWIWSAGTSILLPTVGFQRKRETTG